MGTAGAGSTPAHAQERRRLMTHFAGAQAAGPLGPMEEKLLVRKVSALQVRGRVRGAQDFSLREIMGSRTWTSQRDAATFSPLTARQPLEIPAVPNRAEESWDPRTPCPARPHSHHMLVRDQGNGKSLKARRDIQSGILPRAPRSPSAQPTYPFPAIGSPLAFAGTTSPGQSSEMPPLLP